MGEIGKIGARIQVLLTVMKTNKILEQSDGEDILKKSSLWRNACVNLWVYKLCSEEICPINLGEEIYSQQQEEQSQRPEIGIGLACLRNIDLFKSTEGGRIGQDRSGYSRLGEKAGAGSHGSVETAEA